MARTKYLEWLEEDGLTKITGWARNGLTDEQIAHNMGISVKTLSRWKFTHSPICLALKRGKEVVDLEVENALLKRALGYEYTETTRERAIVRDVNGDPIRNDEGEFIYKLVVTKSVTKEVVPDTTAQIFWLKNRKPAEWRDRKETQLSGSLETTNPLQGFTTEELKKLIRSD